MAALHTPLSYDRHYLTALFEPRSVAIVGATKKAGKVGEVLVSNMRAAGYRGELLAVNPKYRSVHGVPCYASVEKLPQPVDLVVIATPAATVADMISQCGAAGVHAALVITAGFSETGTEGARLEREVVELIRRHDVRMIGPNCLGMLRPSLGLNATFARGGALPGSLALVSQSGAVCTAMLDWAAVNKVGFSSVVSLGGSVDIDFGEIIDYLAGDARTEHILLYIEGVRDARRFLGSLRAAARVKPVILMKVARHPAGSRAAVSHTGAIVGGDDVFDAAVRRAGVVRVETIGQLVAAAQALAAHVRPRGNRLAVITNGGGPGVMAADHATDLGLPLAELSAATVARLQRALPSNWSHGNPVDLIGDADCERYRAAVSACLSDDGVDGALVILTPQAMTDADAAAAAVIDAARGATKPLMACWMGEQSVVSARQALRDAGIPVFRTPEPAVEMFAHLSSFYRNQQALLQMPGPLSHVLEPDLATAQALVDAAVREGRMLLGAAESAALLRAFHIPVGGGLPARSADEAASVAQQTGFPVAMKIRSPDITHKSDVGGVRLGLADAPAVRLAYDEMLRAVRAVKPRATIDGVTIEPMIIRRDGRELLVGVIRDPVFGPAITFGAGGTAVEVMRDRSVALPPLNDFLARDMINGTRVSKLLHEFRGAPAADMAALESVLLRVSEMACALPWLAELDINPLIADEVGVIAIDARVVLAPPKTPGASGAGRYAHMAIHPYPAELAGTCTLADGTCLIVRPIRPEDAALERDFVAGLSDASRRFRFRGTLRELTPAQLARFTHIDYDREMALVALDPAAGREVEVAVARYIANPDGISCEFAIVVADAWQWRGLGRFLLARLGEVARQRGLASMVGQVMRENEPMLQLCRRLGGVVTRIPDDPDSRQVVFTLC